MYYISIIPNNELMHTRSKQDHARCMQAGKPLIPPSPLERDRGFLIYLSCTYRSMCPYHLKGMHQTLDSWRKGRDKVGWKFERREIMLYLASKDGGVGFIWDSEASGDVYPVVRLSSNLQALECLLKGGGPTRFPCRVKKTGWVAYGIGDDASGYGFVWSSDSSWRGLAISIRSVGDCNQRKVFELS